MAKIGDFYNLALGSVEVSSTMNRLYNKVFNDELDIRNVIKLKKYSDKSNKYFLSELY